MPKSSSSSPLGGPPNFRTRCYDLTLQTFGRHPLCICLAGPCKSLPERAHRNEPEDTEQLQSIRLRFSERSDNCCAAMMERRAMSGSGHERSSVVRPADKRQLTLQFRTEIAAVRKSAVLCRFCCRSRRLEERERARQGVKSCCLPCARMGAAAASTRHTRRSRNARSSRAAAVWPPACQGGVGSGRWPPV